MINNKPDTSDIENLLNEHYEETFKTRKTMQTQQQEKIEDFKKYVWSFYGTDEGIYKNFFGNNLKMKEVERAVQIRLSNMQIELDKKQDEKNMAFIQSLGENKGVA